MFFKGLLSGNFTLEIPVPNNIEKVQFGPDKHLIWKRGQGPILPKIQDKQNQNVSENIDGTIVNAEDTKKLVNPILKITVIEITDSDCYLSKLNGNVFIRPKGTKQYTVATMMNVLRPDDTLWLKKGSSVRIGFKDGTYVNLDAPEEDKWFSFEKPEQH